MDKLEQQNLAELKTWIDQQVEMHPRTENEFLLIFLRCCDQDLNLAKNTICKFYENRLKMPQWWRDRDLYQPINNQFLNKKKIIALEDSDQNNPTVVLHILSRYGAVAENFDVHAKLTTIYIEKISKRENCQKNGVIWIIDCRNNPLWTLPHFLSPSNMRHLISSFYVGSPIKVKKLIILQPRMIVYAILKLIYPFLSQSITENIKVIGSDWSSLYETVPRALLPEEYGGHAGALSQHEDAFIRELLLFNDYLLEDERFGYQN